MFPVAILAGGLATRLRPITTIIPKALIEVAGKPFIHHQLTYLKKQGVDRVVLCVGYLGNMIQEAVGDGSEFGLHITYYSDGPKLLGTGGALRNALPALEKNFFVLYGDSYLPVNFRTVQEAYELSKKPAQMTVLQNYNFWDKSNVMFKDGQLIEYNKEQAKPQMTYIDYGLTILNSQILEVYPLGEAFDISKVYNYLSLNGEIAGFEVFERFYEIGSHGGIAEAEAYLLRHP
jgi:NDP-sugar pyrophosphorylase family protein